MPFPQLYFPHIVRPFLHLDCNRWTELLRKRAPAEYAAGHKGGAAARCAAEAERFRNAVAPPGMAEEKGVTAAGKV